MGRRGEAVQYHTVVSKLGWPGMLANFIDEGSGVGSRAALVGSRHSLGPHHQLFVSRTQGRQGLGPSSWRTGAEAVSTPGAPC